MEMDDEEFDFKSEIGQLIVRLQKLCKKPQIDDSLSSAIKIFQEKVTRQKTYLSNGIFNINFAEAALFLQSCAELYGKKIDLLWDQLLEFHTRLIEYDFQHAKEKGKRVNQEAIDQLEERRSRYKRKKKFKLLGKENDTNLLEDFLFDDTESVEMEPCKMDIDCFKSWKSLEHESAVLTKIPKSVYKQQLLKYRMKNYNILKSEDFDLYDPNGEFNTKYSRIPGWHVIEHLFDYNTKGLLPDKNNTIAKLRLSCYLRAQFMRDNNIPFNAPYSEYKDQYLTFREKFFEKEANKWQNMPLQTLLDFSKQLDYLAKMEKENEEKKEKHEPGFEAIPFIPKLTCNIPNCLDCLDSKSSIITISDSLEADLGDIKDLSKNELVVNLEKLPEDVVKKLRMDSGYFECEEKDEELFSFENDIVNSSGNAEDKVTNNMEQIDKTTEKEIVNDSVLMQVEGNSEKIISPTTENTVAITESVLSEKNDDNSSNVNINANTANENVTTGNMDEEDNNEDTRSVFSDHNYCVLPKPGNVDEEDDTRSILSDHDYCVQPNQGNVLKENNTISKENKNMVPLKLASKVVLRVNKIRLAKENRPKIENMGPPPPPKRKKFSSKQVEKLMKSKIVPVNEIKFEKFFSLNYQPQMGEGEVQEVNYESEDEINQEPKETLSGKTVRAIETDDENDDVCSIRSDHSYCQLPEESASNSRTLSHTLTTNDSGFFESVLPSLDRSEEHLNASIGMENVEEYDNNLDEIRDDIERRDDCEEITSLEDLLDAERQKQHETERLESKIRVEEWRQTITPILNNLKEKDFDIHEYGGKIMEGMKIGETKPFKNIVDGKSSAEVVRHFIASLQLANTYNVEICGAKSGELSNDTLSIKLLNIDRYHEHLTDYNAPSEETFRDRLKNVMKESRNLKQIADTKEPKFKRLRLNKTPIKRKLVLSDSDDDDDYETASCSTTPVHSLKHRFKRSSNIRANATITDILQSEDIEVDSSLSDTLSPTIEHFESELTKSQQLNPDMQKFSTPLSVQLTRTVDPVLLRQRSLFS